MDGLADEYVGLGRDNRHGSHRLQGPFEPDGQVRTLLGAKPDSESRSLPDIHLLLKECTAAGLKHISHEFDDLSELAELLHNSISDDPPVTLRDGNLIGKILVPEVVSNLVFGGPKRNRLFMAASQSLYALYVNTQGVAGG